jgi:hypothetical protein
MNRWSGPGTVELRRGGRAGRLEMLCGLRGHAIAGTERRFLDQFTDDETIRYSIALCCLYV